MNRNYYNGLEMIYGIGTDICCVRGIERSYAKRGDLFASEFCNSNELKHVNEAASPATYLAKIFCAKECIGKAVGSGLIPEFWWDDIEVSFRSMCSEVFLSENGLCYISEKLSTNGPWKVDISISNSNSFVSGICVISAS